MTIADIQVTVRGMEQVRDQVETRANRVKNMRPGFDVVADNLEKHVMQTFRTQGYITGKLWPVLARSTQRSRRMEWGYYHKARASDADFRGPSLVWTGDLRSSFTSGHPKNIRRIQRQRMEYGSRDERAVFHAEGAGDLPKRDPIKFRSKEQVRVLVLEPLTLWLRGFSKARIQATSAVRTGQVFDPTL